MPQSKTDRETKQQANVWQRAMRACDAEPIHTPGRIQAHGMMLTLDEDGHVIAVSDNCATFTGCQPNEIFKKPIGVILLAPEELSHVGRTRYGKRPEKREVIEEWGQLMSCQANGPKLEVLSHRNSQDVWVVECEYAEGIGLRLEPHERLFQRRIQQAQQNLHTAPSLQQLIKSAVDEMYACFGFDRVMAYRFDSQWNGAVVAEACKPGLGSYLHQKFPASDIPAQARLTFLKNWLRCIPDVNYEPSALLSSAGDKAQSPLDMMRCHLRAPSTVHIKYLINMGVGGTMTVSLLSEGKLWGLIACHHMKPAVLSFEKRQAAEMIGRTASSLLASKAFEDNSEARQRMGIVQRELFSFMGRDDDLVPGLLKNTPNILDLIEDDTASAAIFFEGRWSFLGAVPPVPELNGLVRWLATQKTDSEVWHTEMLVADYPASEAFSRVASGVMAINIPKSDNTYVLWFRPEVQRVVEWAGNPEKSLEVGEDGPSLHPRKSFQSWRETVKYRSAPWRPVEREAAAILRKNMTELDLKRQFRRERRARADIEAEKQRFRFLADATGLLGRSLDYETTLSDFAKSLSQWFCDWVCIYTTGDVELQRSVIAHATTEGQRVAEEMRRFAPVYVELPELTAAVFEDNKGLYVPRTDAWLRHSEPSDYLVYLTQRLGFESMLLLPFVARGKILGVLKCVRADKARRFSQDDYRLGLQLCQRTASCIDNALLYRSSQQAIQARDHVMGVVSHDLRNPLGAIRLTADRIIRKYDKGDIGPIATVVERGLEKIQMACRRMNGLIEDVLNLSKIEAGRFTVDPQETQVGTLIDEAISFLEPLAEAKNILLISNTDLRDTNIRCDVDRVLQVFSNLIGNAIKFTPEKGVITVTAAPSGDTTIFSVQDTGPGIPTANLPFLFDRFWQARQTARHGAGLGLAIAKGITEAHGGRIWVESTLGEGTCFYFCLAANKDSPR